MSIANLFEGRIKSGYYFGGVVFVSFVSWVISMLLAAIFGADSSVGLGLMAVLGVVCIVLSLGLVIRRFHDLNKSGFYVFLFFIPLVNLVVGLWILFAGGDSAANTYGPVPAHKSFFKALLNQA